LIDKSPRVINERKHIGERESDTLTGEGGGSYFANAYHSRRRRQSFDRMVAVCIPSSIR